ncbi:MAG TPA: family 43 glycosylhydrolase [Paludibacter sp.]|nr:family 43 glycosylhydrolase [Paludibacter sp.]
MKFKSFSLLKNKLWLAIFFCATLVVPAIAKDKTSAYLFVYFTGNRVEEEQICFALSYDGYNYKALNGGKPVINSKDISLTGGVRDPHILRAEDGKTFYMVVTDMTSNKGWDSNRGMVLLKSTDLTNWTSTAINIPTVFPEFADIDRVWAPQTIYDPEAGKYMVYFSMKRKGPGNFDIIYYAYANKDFTALETAPKQLFYHPEGKSCIDGDIVFNKDKYHMFFKTEGHGNGIKKAIVDKLTGKWEMIDKYYQQTTKAVEGAGVFKLNNSDEWILMYDVYSSGYYEFTKSTDLENFSLIQDKISMNFHPRHGTVLPISDKEADRLLKKWQPIDEVLRSVQSKSVKNININIDNNNKTIFLPVKPGTDLTKFNPEFQQNKKVKVKPAKAVDFTKGAVKYKFCVAGRKPETYSVSAAEMRNPALTGLYADPDIIYSNKTGKYYIYPTSDGFDGWSGKYFKVFSSPDMVNWTDEGKIITLGENVKWADRNAWAPTIVEKKINGQYKYFYYFTAAQKIGVAVADNPAGPFTDSGKPLLDARPNGVTRGQVIDPDVFTDPVSGKSYLYWGNGFAAGAELNDDMVSINNETVKVINVPGSFREGSHVLYRDGKYYFMWSIDDTRSPNYAVGYAFMSSPLGELTVPENNVILRKDESKGIYGTGHHSTIQIPGKDEWYIIYHRFNYPNGINMGGSAGFNREVCIDKMEFNADGTIKSVLPTHEGIQVVK